MELIPAIDLRAGNCVRLYQGKKDRETRYSDDPVSMALYWQSQGASRLHLVDLDGAFEEESANKAIIRKILRKVEIPCQVGGGLRSERAVNTLLTAGAAGVIIGTAGVKNPRWLGELVEQFGPEKIIAGVDCEAGEVMIRGWQKASLLDRDTWLEKLQELGVEKIVYTDVGRDGTEQGPDISGLKKILENTSLEVIASGGIGQLEHLTDLNKIDNPRLIGTVVGKALYEHNFTLEQALDAVND